MLKNLRLPVLIVGAILACTLSAGTAFAKPHFHVHARHRYYAPAPRYYSPGYYAVPGPSFYIGPGPSFSLSLGPSYVAPVPPYVPPAPGYIVPGPTANGYYDQWGYWHPYGYYDRWGYWHPY